MNKNRLLSSLIAVMAVLAADAQNPAAPKLVVGILIDQLRSDYLQAFMPLYGEGGFKRLMNEGYNCENTMINYVPTVTAVGHASIFTGSVPAIHGIAGNDFMLDGKMAYCCTDTTVNGVGTDGDAGRMSPEQSGRRLTSCREEAKRNRIDRSEYW